MVEPSTFVFHLLGLGMYTPMGRAFGWARPICRDRWEGCLLGRAIDGTDVWVGGRLMGETLDLAGNQRDCKVRADRYVDTKTHTSLS